jgi:perosamine synthetase
MIPLTRPCLEFDDLSHDLRRIVESGILTSGEYVRGFENDVAEYVGVPHGVATTSATSALHLILAAAEVGPGDEVLVSDFTFPATGNVIAQCGATPVLVDCVASGFQLDLDDAAAKVTARTRALMVVDPFGEPADLARAEALADEHSLLLIEDAACALGAHRDGRACGSWAGAGCFSFHPRKIITTGEGGMITTADDDFADRLRLLRNHGGVRGEVGMTFERHGFNYRLSELQAAIGRAQIRRLDELLAGRRAAAAAYAERLEGFRGLTVPSTANAGATFQSFVVMLDDGIGRDGVVARLREAEIETTLGTYAMHAQPAFEGYGYRPGDLPNSWRAQEQSLTLPLWPGMPTATVDKVTAELGRALAGQS